VDVHKWFPDQENLVTITMIEASNTLLSSFDAKLGDYTMHLFKKRKIDIRTGVRVAEVQRHHIILSDGSSIPFGYFLKNFLCTFLFLVYN
jgi:NADH dehydrogenase FAD-containing subunit